MPRVRRRPPVRRDPRPISEWSLAELEGELQRLEQNQPPPDNTDEAWDNLADQMRVQDEVWRRRRQACHE
jgi:hypothetical protein